MTEEFFKNIKKIGKNINTNIISDLELKTDFSKNLFNTMQKTFWKLYFKSELDENRRYEILEYLTDNQVFITTTDKSFINDFKNINVIEMEKVRKERYE